MMRNRVNVRLGLVLLIALLTGCQTAPAVTRKEDWATPIGSAALENFFQVERNVLYRSAKITDMNSLRGLPIRTVVNLRELTEDPLTPPGVLGISIPMDPSTVSDEDVIRFLRIVRTPCLQPVLVHCTYGSDRTGAMVAAYRMVVQGWSADKAIEEMQHGGYGFHSIFENLPNYLREMNVKYIEEQTRPPDSPKTK